VRGPCASLQQSVSDDITIFLSARHGVKPTDSWWVAQSREDFARRAAAELPRMLQSKFARIEHQIIPVDRFERLGTRERGESRFDG
jgi:hypothetical protein